MPYHQLDRISSTDEGFLHQEGPHAHMHIGGLIIAEGAPPAHDELMARIRSRLHIVPRYRQRLIDPPFGTGRPIWVDDTTFNLDFHVRPIALPAPGTFEDLLTLTGRLMSLRLDRAKPLWELWVIGGLEPEAGSDTERFALFTKWHHSLSDGISGVGIATVILDLPEGSTPIDVSELRPWHPRPAPTEAEQLLDGVRVAASATLGFSARVLRAARRPRQTTRNLLQTAEGLGEVAWAMMNPAPETPLNVPIGPHRRYRVVTHSWADYKAIRDHFDATINDVFVAMVTGGLAHWMRSRGLRTEGVQLHSLVPVSIRTEDDRGELGNKLTVMRAPLPIYAEDPRSRIETVVAEMELAKASKLPNGALTVVAFNEAAPPALVAQTSRVQFSTRLFNMLVTNVPGPRTELSFLGRPLHDVYPLAFLSENQALAIAIVSYNGKIEYGLLGDYDALPDLDVIAEGIQLALAETLELIAADDAAAAPAGAAAGTEPAPAPADVASILPTGAEQSAGPATALRAKRSTHKPKR